MDGSPILAALSKLLQRIYIKKKNEISSLWHVVPSVPTVEPCRPGPPRTSRGPPGLHRISKEGKSPPILQSKSERTREEEKYGKRADYSPRRNQTKSPVKGQEGRGKHVAGSWRAGPRGPRAGKQHAMAMGQYTDRCSAHSIVANPYNNQRRQNVRLVFNFTRSLSFLKTASFSKILNYLKYT